MGTRIYSLLCWAYVAWRGFDAVLVSGRPTQRLLALDRERFRSWNYVLLRRLASMAAPLHVMLRRCRQRGYTVDGQIAAKRQDD